MHHVRVPLDTVQQRPFDTARFRHPTDVVPGKVDQHRVLRELLLVSAQVRLQLGIDPSRTVAVGDGRNDIEMLGWAGRGVAMGQAPEEVIAVADEVTASVFDDGAALVLRSLL